VKKLLGLVIVVAAVGAVLYHRSAPPPVISYADWTTEPIDTGSVTEIVTATGVVQPRDMVAVGAESAGRVVRVFVEPGQHVKAGDALCQLDDRLAVLRSQQARLAVELAQAEVARAEAARDAATLTAQRARDPAGQIQPVANAESAEYQRRGAEAALRAAQVRLREAQTGQQLAELAVDQTVVRAPVAGTVIEKRLAVGQLIGPPAAAHLFTIAPELEYFQVTALVSESDVARIRVGQPASLTVNAWGEHTFDGKVTRVGQVAAAVPGAVQYPVTIDVPNVRDPAGKEWMLRSGMTATAELIVRRHDGVWRLPAAAVGVTFDESRLSDQARRKLARGMARADRADWQRVWALTADRGPWPLFLRTGGKNARGEPGLQDSRHIEILAWDPEESEPAPGATLRAVTGVPDSALPAKPGLKLF
jgi:RND family efflux transporter MFP subunit